MNKESLMQAAQFVGKFLSVNQNEKLHQIVGSILAAWLMYQGAHEFVATTVIPFLMELQKAGS